MHEKCLRSNRRSKDRSFPFIFYWFNRKGRNMIDIVDEKDIKYRKTADKNGNLHVIYSERKCCYPGCSHPYETFVDPKTGVHAWYKAKTIVDGEKVWDGESYYCNEHEHKMRKQTRLGTLKTNSNRAKGNRIERAFKKIGYINCNEEKDNYNYPHDLFDPIKKLRIQVRSTEIKLWTKKWTKVDGTKAAKTYSGWFILSDFDINYDDLFAVCTTKDYLDIERIYVIPKNRLSKRQGFHIYKENIESHLQIKSQYSDCKDDELLQKIRDTYREILIEDEIIK